MEEIEAVLREALDTAFCVSGSGPGVGLPPAVCWKTDTGGAYNGKISKGSR